MYQMARMLAITLSRSALRGLHHAVGDAPGEVVLEERPALPHHVPVALPADQAGDAGHQHGVADRHVDPAAPAAASPGRTTISASSGHFAASAAWRSVASISETSWPRNTGTIVSSAATPGWRRTWPRTSPSSAARSASRTRAGLAAARQWPAQPYLRTPRRLSVDQLLRLTPLRKSKIPHSSARRTRRVRWSSTCFRRSNETPSPSWKSTSASSTSTTSTATAASTAASSSRAPPRWWPAAW